MKGLESRVHDLGFTGLEFKVQVKCLEFWLLGFGLRVHTSELLAANHTGIKQKVPTNATAANNMLLPMTMYRHRLPRAMLLQQQAKKMMWQHDGSMTNPSFKCVNMIDTEDGYQSPSWDKQELIRESFKQHSCNGLVSL